MGVLEPVPVMLEPVPVMLEPVPVMLEPVPVMLEPVPVMLEPVPVTLEPVPAATQDAAIQRIPGLKVANCIVIILESVRKTRFLNNFFKQVN